MNQKECDGCICITCINQPDCARSCNLCKYLKGTVSFCKDECRCEQITFGKELIENGNGKEV